MAITLNANLQAKLDTETRDPIIQLNALGDDNTPIPFDGVRLHDLAVINEEWPDGIVHSDGRYLSVYQRNDTALQTHIYFKASSDDRITWSNPIKLTATGDSTFNEFPSLVELSNDNVGIVWSERIGAARTLRYMVVDKAGAIVTASTSVQNQTGIYYESSLTRRNDGSIILVAARDNTGTWQITRQTHAAGAWSSWSTTTVLTFTGATVTGEKRRPFVKEVEITPGSTYRQHLAFDRVDETSGSRKRTNVYRTSSAQGFDQAGGESGGYSVVAVTSFSPIGNSGEDPSIAQVSTNQFWLAYCNRRSSIKLDTTTTPALGNDDADFVFHDQANRWIVLVDRAQPFEQSTDATGVKILNTLDFSLYRSYTTATTPSIGGTRKMRAYYDSPLLVLGHSRTPWTPGTDTDSFIDVIDILNNTVTKFYYSNADAVTPDRNALKFKVTNINGNIIATIIESISIFENEIYFATEDAGALRIYKLPRLPAGDTVEATWVGEAKIFPESPQNGGHEHGYAQRYCFWDFNNGFLYYAYKQEGGAGDAAHGYIAKVNLATGGLVMVWRDTTHNGWTGDSAFPKQGVAHIWVDGDRLFGAIYDNVPIHAAEETGLIVINLTTNAITNFTGSIVGTSKVNQLRGVRAKGNGQMMLFTEDNGLAIYDPNSNSVSKVYDETNVLGWPTQAGAPTDCCEVADAVYDPINRRYYLALDKARMPGGTVGGFLAFDEDGDITQMFYREVTSLDSGQGALQAQASLTTGTDDSQLTLLRNGAGIGLAAFWSRRILGGTEQDLYFDEEIGSLDLLPYWAGKLQIRQSLEHEPNSMAFEVLRGDLFDPINQNSLLRNRLDPGSIVQIKKGERTAAGSFVETLFTGRVDHASGVYSKSGPFRRRIVVYDQSKALYDYRVPVTPSYGDGTFPNLPDGNAPANGIIAHALSVLGSIPDADIAIGTFDNAVPLEFQLADVSVIDFVELVANRFQRVVYVNNEGKFVAKKVAINIGVTDFFDNDNITISYNPEENESDLTNRVTVRGISDNELQVELPEQVLKDVNGVTGWVQGYSAHLLVPYSDDLSVEANPGSVHLEILVNPGNDRTPFYDPFTPETVGQAIRGSQAPLFYLKRISQQPNAGELVDFYNRRICRIDLDMENDVADFLNRLFAMVNVGLAGLFILGLLANIPIFGSFPTAAAIMAIAAMLKLIAELFTSMSRIFFYHIRVHGRVYSKVRQEIQASADDVDLQNKLNGHIVERVVDFPFAFTQSVCQIMADWLLLRTKLTREPFALQMLGHVRQEPGDVVEFRHPISAAKIKGLVWGVEREFERGKSDTQNLTVLVFGDEN